MGINAKGCQMNIDEIKKDIKAVLDKHNISIELDSDGEGYSRTDNGIIVCHNETKEEVLLSCKYETCVTSFDLARDLKELNQCSKLTN